MAEAVEEGRRALVRAQAAYDAAWASRREALQRGAPPVEVAACEEALRGAEAELRRAAQRLKEARAGAEPRRRPGP